MKKTIIALFVLSLLSACGASSSQPTVTAASIPDERLREVERQLLALANETRAAEGKPALTYSDELARVALGHSRDMFEHGFMAHESPRTGSPHDRLVSAGVRSSLVLENLAEAEGAMEIHRGWLDSPSHHGNLVNADVNYVGIGVVALTRNGQTRFIATQLFARLTDAVDLNTAPTTVLAAVNATRAARNAAPLELDTNLTSAAQEAAARFFSDATVTEQALLDQASDGLRRFSIQFRRIGGVMTVVTSLDEASQLEPVLDGAIRYVGIGVAQGTRPDTPSNAVVVVFMLGWAR